MKGATVGKIEVVLMEKKLIIACGDDVASFSNDVADDLLEALLIMRFGVVDEYGNEEKTYMPESEALHIAGLPKFPASNMLKDEDGNIIAARDPVTRRIYRFRKKKDTDQASEVMAQLPTTEVTEKKKRPAKKQAPNGAPRDILPLCQITKKKQAWPIIEHFLKESGRPRTVKEIVDHMHSAGYEAKNPEQNVYQMLTDRKKRGEVIRSGKKGSYKFAVP